MLGEGGSEGVLIAKGERWRWQRQLLSPLFRAEEIAGYVPARAPVLARWNKKGYSTDMAVGRRERAKRYGASPEIA